jgi:hypothetical protein
MMVDDLHILNHTQSGHFRGGIFWPTGVAEKAKQTVHGPEGNTRGILSRENDRSVNYKRHVKASILAGCNEP